MPLYSIDDIIPDEEGGPIARIGFNYQDEITVSFLLEMLELPSLIKVHCETHDDIVLVHKIGKAPQIAEYVQVKGNDLDKLWSVADISSRKSSKSKNDNEEKGDNKEQKGKESSSIFETSFNRDKHIENSKFRIVTLRAVDSELKILTYPFGSPGRKKDCNEFKDLYGNLAKRFPALTSVKNNGIDYWLENCYWDVRHDEKTVAVKNQHKIILMCFKHGLLPEQAETLLDELRSMAKAAGAARWKADKDKKIITRESLLEWWNKRISYILNGSKGASGTRLTDKLVEAGLGNMALIAGDFRRDYSESRLNPRYMSADEREDLQYIVRSELTTLQSNFLADSDNNPAQFHNICIERMDEISNRYAGSASLAAYLKGCMYDIADRCRLQFKKPVL